MSVCKIESCQKKSKSSISVKSSEINNAEQSTARLVEAGGNSTPNETPKRSPCPRRPRRNIALAKLLEAWKIFNDHWMKITNDPFHWQLLKSITFFVIGLKLFDDIKRHSSINT
ncbi:unnamed protein product [Colias eurytheme]|nr:unnamed protein product [Colias eurytheme]